MGMTLWTTTSLTHLSKGELIELIDELKTELEMKKQISKAHQKLNGELQGRLKSLLDINDEYQRYNVKLEQKMKQQDKDAKEMLLYP